MSFFIFFLDQDQRLHSFGQSLILFGGVDPLKEYDRHSKIHHPISRVES